jgi:hypothetical protein
MEDYERQPGPGTVSAKNIPRPSTTLSLVGKTGLGKFKVSYLGDKESTPSITEVSKINLDPRVLCRTPLMTVVQSVLSARNGTLELDELLREVRKYWNRPLPASPYTDEEFLYVVLKESPDIRVGD